MPDSSTKPSLFIQLTHTGRLQDGRPNANPVQVTDLDVGYENALRKVPVYVPVGGSIIIPASSRSMLSFQQGVISKFAQAGVLTAKMFYQPEVFTTATRPSADKYPKGVAIWNEEEHAPNYSDGVTWVSFAAGGPPAPHETSHATGGTDALTVDPTTATNNSNTTGLTVNSGIASLSVTDPGHTHSIASVAPAISSATLVMHETFYDVGQNARSLGTIDQSVATASPTGQVNHYRTVDVVFPAGWAGGIVSVIGRDRFGAALTVTYSTPGPGGGLVHGLPIFSLITSFSNSAPGGGSGTTATVQIGSDLGAASPPAAFLKLAVNGTQEAFVGTDLVNGSFTPTTAPNGNRTYEVWYTTVITVTQTAHDHGAATGSHTTGVSVSDSGHTHGTTDPGHDHTQSPHAHNLT